jgi:gliding motility-associated-like protein
MFRFTIVFIVLSSFLTNSNAQSYGSSSATNYNSPNSELITRVNFGTIPFSAGDISNPSVSGETTSPCTGYSDFTISNNSNTDGNGSNDEFITGVVKSQTYELEVLGGGCSSSFLSGTANRALRVYIDYNDDGDFTDPGEEVWESSAVIGYQQVTNPLFSASITIPINAVLGELRMRLIYNRLGVFFFLWPFAGPTDSYLTGETEDYSVFVTGYVNSIATVNPTCVGDLEGELIITPEVTAPAGIEYSINGLVGPWTTDTDYDGLSTGVYDVWARDPSLAPNYVYEQYQATISDPEEVIFTGLVSSDYNGEAISCAGFSDGEISIFASGGDNSNYTYQFVDQLTGSVGLSTSNIIESLSADTYEITVIDAQGCSSLTQDYALLDPSLISIGGVAVTSSYIGGGTSCNGVCDAELTITPGGGTAPYTYAVNGINNGTSNVVPGVCAGIAGITIQDVNSCSFMTNVPVSEPALLSINSVSTTSDFNGEDISCVGSADGSISVVASGGIGTYSFSTTGNIPFNLSNNISSLSAQVYPVAVQDQNGCVSTTFNHAINDPFPLSLGVIVTTPISCNGFSDGEVTLQGIGGTGAYQYSDDNGISFQSSGVFSAQSSGNNTYMVSDDNNCQASQIFNVPEPTSVTFTANITSDYNGGDISCFGADDAVIAIVPQGGAGIYSYALNGSVAEASLPLSNQVLGVASGNYTISVFDQNNCVSNSQALSVSEPNLLQIDNVALISDVNCFGEANGAMLVDASGGTGSYSYFAGMTYNASNQSPYLVEGLTAGTYSVVVTDENGCFTNAVNQIVDEPVLLQANVSSTNLGCNGDDSGTALVNYFGGTPNYSVLWSTNQTSNSITDLVAGDYSVTVTDNNSCVATVDFEITEPVLSTQTIQMICFGDNVGEIELTLENPNPASVYSYLWDDPSGQTTLTASNLSAGIYTASVIDQFGCVLSISDTIYEPDSMSVFVDKTFMCVEKPYSSATVFTSGGLDPYDYQWSTTENTEQIVIDVAGAYSVEVTDDNGCQQEVTFDVDPIRVLSVDYVIDNPSCKDNLDGQVIVEVTGGYPPYQYNWSDASQDSILSAVAEGTYSLDAFDSHGCYIAMSATLIASSSTCLEVYSAFSPNGDQNNDFWYIENIELYPDALVEVFNRWGDRVYASKLYVNAWDGAWNGTFKGESLPSATYYYVITLNNEENQYVGTVTIVR